MTEFLGSVGSWLLSFRGPVKLVVGWVVLVGLVGLATGPLSQAREKLLCPPGACLTLTDVVPSVCLEKSILTA